VAPIHTAGCVTLRQATDVDNPERNPERDVGMLMGHRKTRLPHAVCTHEFTMIRQDATKNRR